MKTRAAVAWKAGAALSIETADLEGPQAGAARVEVGPGVTTVVVD